MTESEYHDACDRHEKACREAAEACNEILTLEQGRALLAAMRAMPEAAVMLAETVFEEYGWPSSDVDEFWLSDAGQYTWQCYRKRANEWQSEQHHSLNKIQARCDVTGLAYWIDQTKEENHD